MPREDALQSAMSKFRSSASRLNQLTDSAAAAVKQLEGFLQECGIGLHAFVRIPEFTESNEPAFLEWRRVGQAYRICVVLGAPEHETVKPWSDCTREVKLSAIAALPNLVTELATGIDKQAVAAQRAVETVTNVLKSLEG